MDTIRIGLCDDVPQALGILRRYIEELQEKLNGNWSIEQFLSGKDLLQNAGDFDVIFLDIEMPELDGIETGKQLALLNPECKIIMATGAVERFKDAFRINAFRFVTKPFDRAEVWEALESVVKNAVGTNTLELFLQRQPFMIAEKNIEYIRAYNGYSEFAVGDQIFRKDISLDEAQALLDDRIFARIHRQYIVNLGSIADYRNGIVYIGGEKLAVSRRSKKEFEQKYVEYDLKYR